jgi:hypothetical protein
VSDKFEEGAGKLASIGISQIPVVGLIAQVAQAFLPPGADERLKKAIQDDLESRVVRLQARIDELAKELAAQGKVLAELGAVRTAMLFREFAEASTRSGSSEKSDALICAAARQFDPNMGSDAFRRFWYDVVVALTDVEVALVRLLLTYKQVTIALEPRHQVTAVRWQDGQRVDLPMPEAEALALFGADAKVTGIDALFTRDAESGIPGTRIRLTQRGRVVASFIKD